MSNNTKLSLKTIRHSLLQLGLEAGQIVMLHASLRTIGRVESGPRGLLDAILGILTIDGTLMMLKGKRVIQYKEPVIEDGQRKLAGIKRFDTRRDIPGYVKKDYFGPMVEDYLRQGGGKSGRVGKATSYILDAQEFKQFGVFWLESNLPSVKA